ncbi:MAG: ribosomal-protein-alanine N-acetyltransferase RimI, partial [Clostridia bacterium]|nr:ribosomal-protein-alanine N-acetyltransferase RimI [Clostridia bacterium]
ATRMTLEVREHNYGAQALYSKCGFVKAGIRPGYYSDTGEAALILWNDDIPSSLEKLVPGAL